ncbi:hypothetical protein DL93DRAFT_2069377 [Clavulina sp. PMI_390]|nr:hypothetical protein DL93DRAFT_2069377 [Clavulina sp. PMI_390]
MIERGHRTWIESVWKMCQRHKDKWSEWFYAGMWADRVTARRSTGFSPYHLIYGKPHIFPFALTEATWYTINWHKIETTEDLLEVRARQLRRLQEDRATASDNNIESRRRAAEQFAIKNAHRLTSGLYRAGEYVLVALKGANLKKGYGRVKSADRWGGPYRIYGRYKSGSYSLKELDGTIIRGSVPPSHLKPFYTNEHQVVGEDLILTTDEEEGEFEWTADEESDDAGDSPYIE